MCAYADKHRGFTLTLNNYTDDEYNKLKSMAQRHTEKWIIGKEVGEKCGTPHLQGYIYFKNARKYDSMKKTIIKTIGSERCTVLRAKGNPNQNYDYCSKEGNFLCEGYDKVKKIMTQEEINKMNEFKSLWNKGYFGSRSNEDDETIEIAKPPMKRIKKYYTKSNAEVNYERGKLLM